MRPTPPRFPRDANRPIEDMRDDAVHDADGHMMKVANLTNIPSGHPKIDHAPPPKVREVCI